MSFCSNCGHVVVDGTKFCAKCGANVSDKVGQQQAERKMVYEGELQKCPNCGEVLKSFDLNCPACGHELRNRKSSSAVKEFALKLEAIEASREYEKPRGFFRSPEAQQRVTKTDEQKISLINSFPVPNTKEDMLEFMVLANREEPPYKTCRKGTGFNLTDSGELSIRDRRDDQQHTFYNLRGHTFGGTVAGRTFRKGTSQNT